MPICKTDTCDNQVTYADILVGSICAACRAEQAPPAAATPPPPATAPATKVTAPPAVAAPPPPARPVLRRSDSFSGTHRPGSGVVAKLRVTTGETVRHSAQFVAGKCKNRVREHHDMHRRKGGSGYDHAYHQADYNISCRDAEAQLIADQLMPISRHLRDADATSSTIVEFHTNFGPCDACKNRIERATEVWRDALSKGQQLKVICYYRRAPVSKTRGKKKIATTYGLSDAEPTCTYGPTERNAYGLHSIDFGTWHG